MQIRNGGITKSKITGYSICIGRPRTGPVSCAYHDFRSDLLKENNGKQRNNNGEDYWNVHSYSDFILAEIIFNSSFIKGRHIKSILTTREGAKRIRKSP